uniref:Homoserine kinase n=1 Tax=Lygus hesperus TaxID=30085 RepID=A0A0A9WRZ9_LYGHE
MSCAAGGASTTCVCRTKLRVVLCSAVVVESQTAANTSRFASIPAPIPLLGTLVGTPAAVVVLLTGSPDTAVLAGCSVVLLAASSAALFVRIWSADLVIPKNSARAPGDVGSIAQRLCTFLDSLSLEIVAAHVLVVLLFCTTFPPGCSHVLRYRPHCSFFPPPSFLLRSATTTSASLLRTTGFSPHSRISTTTLFPNLAVVRYMPPPPSLLRCHCTI